ncbi:MAG: class I SAM-dependent methyltransferase [Caulobacteraceae bacterium]
MDWTRRGYLDRHTPRQAWRILDYGCGAGEYLARVAGPDRKLYGADLIAPADAPALYTWLDLDKIDGAAPFDCIVLGHVLEHLADPSAVVAHLAGALAPDGGLWIATPNADSFLFAAAGPWARDIDFPRHREIFGRAGLERLLAEVGLRAAFVSPPRVNAVLNAAATARNLLLDRELAWHTRAWKTARMAARLLIHMVKPAARRDRESPELVAVCRRLDASRAGG